jgi:hypothetical protein
MSVVKQEKNTHSRQFAKRVAYKAYKILPSSEINKYKLK